MYVYAQSPLILKLCLVAKYKPWNPFSDVNTASKHATKATPVHHIDSKCHIQRQERCSIISKYTNFASNNGFKKSEMLVIGHQTPGFKKSLTSLRVANMYNIHVQLQLMHVELYVIRRAHSKIICLIITHLKYTTYLYGQLQNSWLCLQYNLTVSW